MELSEFLPWDKLTVSQQQALTSGAQVRTFAKGTVVHNGAMGCTGLLAVRSGQLRAHILSEEGREVTLYRLFPMDMCLFSASCIMNSIQFEIVIQAEKDTQAWLIQPEVYRGVMEQSAPLANYTNEIMASRFSEVMWRIEQILWKRFDSRLAEFLLEEAALEETDSLKLTHEAIGSHLGTAREVVTRMLRYFQGEGMVALSRGTIQLTDRKKLQKLSES